MGSGENRAMPAFCAPLLAWLFALLWPATGAAAAEVPPQYPPEAAQGPVVPFIGADGLGLPSLRRRDLERQLGAPESVEPGRGGGQDTTPLVLRYASRGLEFQIDARHAADVDPPVGWAVMTLPFAGRTPQGLYLGMPQAEAMPLIQSLYRRKYSIPFSYGQGYGQVKGEGWGGRNQGWRETQAVMLDFRAGRLHRMSFQVEPTPLVRLSTLRGLLGSLLVMVTAAALGMGLLAIRRRMGPWWERMRLGLGVLLALGGVAGLAIAAGGMGGGDPYGRMAALLFGMVALGALLVALLVFAGSSHRAFSRPAMVVLGLGLLALLLSKLL